MYHKPVMLQECIDALNIRPNGIYVDATFGGGGHAKAILEHLSDGKLFAFDRDPDAIARHTGDERLTLIQQDYRYMLHYLTFHRAIPVDGILADLGISSHQIDRPERGFSTRYEAQLDMRMDQKGARTAADLLNRASLEELSHLFKQYGEVKNAYNLAKKIVATRNHTPITTTQQLNEIAAPFSPKKNPSKYLAQVYQALRIEVNDELNGLKELLRQAEQVLAKGGRLVLMSYHSLEDRLVKNFLKTGNFEGVLQKDFFGNVIAPFQATQGRVITASEEEVAENPRSRSARLRIGVKQ
ncbi:MAG: 16S rRNA (cytosine(1402)-N(4))-methyltransferase [Bacteroidetes bacterium]|nr:MAG: 16S rRNA (cytosine(1402)-N(4))-methyltransferase [Bacteroidota bacterium]PIE88167.1 MAG: 16S rRNA (cytosine(1402)-N(4))-methyltransferase [Bacteroidota bacterium]